MALPALLSHDDLVKFRTRFCERFLQYGECNFGDKCQYSHNMLWRRRSPQKHIYEPRLCDNLIVWTGPNGKRLISNNCHNGKNCRFAHSREEILYHPSVYKAMMCELSRCTRYYCPFCHSTAELQQQTTMVGSEYARDCLGPYRDQRELFNDDASVDSDLEDDFMSSGDAVFVSSTGGGRLRKGSCSSSVCSAASSSPARISFSDFSCLDCSGVQSSLYSQLNSSSGERLVGWTQVSVFFKIENLVRAKSPVMNSDLCKSVLVRPDKKLSNLQNQGNAGNTLSQSGLAKILRLSQLDNNQDIIVSQFLSDLHSVARTEHKNLVSIRKIHTCKTPLPQNSLSSNSTGVVSVALALEQCSTSLYQLVSDGYRGYSYSGRVRSAAKRLNAHDGVISPIGIQRILDILSGILKLHSIGICHMRICPTNILVDSEASFKLADFCGKLRLLQILEKGRSEFVPTFLQEGVVPWMPPEIIGQLKALDGSQGENDNSNSYQLQPQTTLNNHTSNNLNKVTSNYKKIDVWQAGVVIFFAMTGQHLFGTFSDDDKWPASGVNSNNASSGFLGGVESLIHCILDGNSVNQHLLYDVPLVLDLVFRMTAKNPVHRPDINDIAKHPLFWDLSTLTTFLKSLPIGSSESGRIFRSFCDYPLRWEFFLSIEERSLLGSVFSSLSTVKQTILGLLIVLQSLVSTRSDSSSMSVVLNILQRHPLVLVRAWDGLKLPSEPGNLSKFSEIFQRPHLNWMENQNALCLSSDFILEYYNLLFVATHGNSDHSLAPVHLLPLDKLHTSSPLFAYESSFSHPFSPTSSSSSSLPSLWAPPNQQYFASLPLLPPAAVSYHDCMSSTTSTSPLERDLAIRQVAAASTALSTIYSNPSLIPVLSGCPIENPPSEFDKLSAAATIYTSLLQTSANESSSDGITTNVFGSSSSSSLAEVSLSTNLFIPPCEPTSSPSSPPSCCSTTSSPQIPLMNSSSSAVIEEEYLLFHQERMAQEIVASTFFPEDIENSLSSNTSASPSAGSKLLS